VNLSPTARWLLTGLAAGVSAFGALIPTLSGVPTWVGVAVAVLGATFAGLGIVAPGVGGTQQGVVNPSLSEPPRIDGEAGYAGVSPIIVVLLVILVALIIYALTGSLLLTLLALLLLLLLA
jgi:hypothetical protein